MTRTRAVLRFPSFILAVTAISCDGTIVSTTSADFTYDEIRPTLTLTDEYGEVQVTQQDASQEYIEYSGSLVLANGGDPIAVEYRFPTDMSGWEVESESLDDGWGLHHVYDPDGQPVSDVYVQQVDDVASGYVENLENGTTSWFDWTNVQMVGTAEDASAKRARTSNVDVSWDPTTNTWIIIIIFVPITNCVPTGVDPQDYYDDLPDQCPNVCQAGSKQIIEVDPSTCDVDCPCYPA